MNFQGSLLVLQKAISVLLNGSDWHGSSQTKSSKHVLSVRKQEAHSFVTDGLSDQFRHKNEPGYMTDSHTS